MIWEFSKKFFFLGFLLITFNLSTLARDFAPDNGRRQNKLQEENFHEPNRWKPPVRLKPFDTKFFARFHIKEENTLESDSESGIGPTVPCDDEDGDCGDGEEASGAGGDTESTLKPTERTSTPGKDTWYSLFSEKAKTQPEQTVTATGREVIGVFSKLLSTTTTALPTTTTATTALSRTRASTTTKALLTKVSKLPRQNFTMKSNLTNLRKDLETIRTHTTTLTTHSVTPISKSDILRTKLIENAVINETSTQAISTSNATSESHSRNYLVNVTFGKSNESAEETAEVLNVTKEIVTKNLNLTATQDKGAYNDSIAPIPKLIKRKNDLESTTAPDATVLMVSKSIENTSNSMNGVIETDTQNGNATLSSKQAEALNASILVNETIFTSQGNGSLKSIIVSGFNETSNVPVNVSLLTDAPLTISNHSDVKTAARYLEAEESKPDKNQSIIATEKVPSSTASTHPSSRGKSNRATNSSISTLTNSHQISTTIKSIKQLHLLSTTNTTKPHRTSPIADATKLHTTLFTLNLTKPSINTKNNSLCNYTANPIKERTRPKNSSLITTPLPVHHTRVMNSTTMDITSLLVTSSKIFSANNLKDLFAVTNLTTTPWTRIVHTVSSENFVEVLKRGHCKGITCLSGGICKEDGASRGRCLCPVGKGGKRCDIDVQFTHPKFRGSSYLMFSRTGKQRKNFRISIRFKSDLLNGLLLFGGNPRRFSKDFLAVLLIDGYVQLRTKCGSGFLAISSSKRITPSQWHRITIRKFDGKIHMQHDGAPVVIAEGRCLQREERYDVFYLGGLNDTALQLRNVGLIPGFSGCVMEFMLEGKDYLNDSRIMANVSGFDVHDCSGGSCLENRCLNGGVCLPAEGNSFECSCSLGYSGSYCSKAANVSIPNFNGAGYLKFEGLGSRAWSQLHLEMTIKPKSKDGLLLYNGDRADGRGDFILLALKNGSVELRFDCGTGTAVIRTKRQLKMDTWYHIKVNRRGKFANLTVDDNETVTGSSKGPFQMLKLREPLFIGGTNSFVNIPLAADVHSYFQGCIEKIKINNNPVIWSNAVFGRNVSDCKSHECSKNSCSGHGTCESFKGRSWCHCNLGYRGRSCEAGTRITVPRFNGHSFLKFDDKDLFRHMSLPTSVVSLEFKSNISNGLILWNGQKSSVLRWRGDYFSISLYEGYLICRYNLGSGDIILKSKHRLNDGIWHKAVLYRHEGKGEMEIDDVFMSKADAIGSYIMLNTDGELYVGGAANIYLTTGSRHLHGFDGCIRNLSVGKTTIDLISNASGGHHVDQCR